MTAIRFGQTHFIRPKNAADLKGIQTQLVAWGLDPKSTAFQNVRVDDGDGQPAAPAQWGQGIRLWTKKNAITTILALEAVPDGDYDQLIKSAFGQRADYLCDPRVNMSHDEMKPIVNRMSQKP